MQSLDEFVLKERINTELRSKKIPKTKRVGLYKSGDVFEYLKKLASKRKIQLDYETMDEIVGERLHMKPIGAGLIF